MELVQLPPSWIYKTSSPNPHPLILPLPFELLHGKRYMEAPTVPHQVDTRHQSEEVMETLLGECLRGVLKA